MSFLFNSIFFLKFEGSKADYKSSAGCVVPDPIRFHARHWSLRHCFFLYVTSLSDLPPFFLNYYFVFCWLLSEFPKFSIEYLKKKEIMKRDHHELDAV